MAPSINCNNTTIPKGKATSVVSPPLTGHTMVSGRKATSVASRSNSSKPASSGSEVSERTATSVALRSNSSKPVTPLLPSDPCIISLAKLGEIYDSIKKGSLSDKRNKGGLREKDKTQIGGVFYCSQNVLASIIFGFPNATSIYNSLNLCKDPRACGVQHWNQHKNGVLCGRNLVGQCRVKDCARVHNPSLTNITNVTSRVVSQPIIVIASQNSMANAVSKATPSVQNIPTVCCITMFKTIGVALGKPVVASICEKQGFVCRFSHNPIPKSEIALKVDKLILEGSFPTIPDLIALVDVVKSFPNVCIPEVITGKEIINYGLYWARERFGKRKSDPNALALFNNDPSSPREALMFELCKRLGQKYCSRSFFAYCVTTFGDPLVKYNKKDPLSKLICASGDNCLFAPHYDCETRSVNYHNFITGEPSAEFDNLKVQIRRNELELQIKNLVSDLKSNLSKLKTLTETNDDPKAILRNKMEISKVESTLSVIRPQLEKARNELETLVLTKDLFHSTHPLRNFRFFSDPKRRSTIVTPIVTQEFDESFEESFVELASLPDSQQSLDVNREELIRETENRRLRTIEEIARITEKREAEIQEEYARIKRSYTESQTNIFITEKSLDWGCEFEKYIHDSFYTDAHKYFCQTVNVELRTTNIWSQFLNKAKSERLSWDALDVEVVETGEEDQTVEIFTHSSEKQKYANFWCWFLRIPKTDVRSGIVGTTDAQRVAESEPQLFADFLALELSITFEQWLRANFTTVYELIKSHSYIRWCDLSTFVTVVRPVLSTMTVDDFLCNKKLIKKFCTSKASGSNGVPLDVFMTDPEAYLTYYCVSRAESFETFKSLRKIGFKTVHRNGVKSQYVYESMMCLPPSMIRAVLATLQEVDGDFPTYGDQSVVLEHLTKTGLLPFNVSTVSTTVDENNVESNITLANKVIICLAKPKNFMIRFTLWDTLIVELFTELSATEPNYTKIEKLIQMFPKDYSNATALRDDALNQLQSADEIILSQVREAGLTFLFDNNGHPTSIYKYVLDLLKSNAVSGNSSNSDAQSKRVRQVRESKDKAKVEAKQKDFIIPKMSLHNKERPEGVNYYVGKTRGSLCVDTTRKFYPSSYLVVGGSFNKASIKEVRDVVSVVLGRQLSVIQIAELQFELYIKIAENDILNSSEEKVTDDTKKCRQFIAQIGKKIAQVDKEISFDDTDYSDLTNLIHSFDYKIDPKSLSEAEIVQKPKKKDTTVPLKPTKPSKAKKNGKGKDSVKPIDTPTSVPTAPAINSQSSTSTSKNPTQKKTKALQVCHCRRSKQFCQCNESDSEDEEEDEDKYDFDAI